MTDTRQRAERAFEARYGFTPRIGRDNAGVSDQARVDEFEREIERKVCPTCGSHARHRDTTPNGPCVNGWHAPARYCADCGGVFDPDDAPARCPASGGTAYHRSEEFADNEAKEEER